MTKRNIWFKLEGNKSQWQWPEHHNIYTRERKIFDNIYSKYLLARRPRPQARNYCLIIAIIPEMIRNDEEEARDIPEDVLVTIETVSRCRRLSRCCNITPSGPHTASSSPDTIYCQRHSRKMCSQSDSSASSVSHFTYPKRQSWSIVSFLWIQQCVCILFLFILLPSCSTGQSPDTHCRIQKTHSLEHHKYLFSQVTSSLASLSLYMKLSLRIVKKIST